MYITWPAAMRSLLLASVYCAASLWCPSNATRASSEFRR